MRSQTEGTMHIFGDCFTHTHTHTHLLVIEGFSLYWSEPLCAWALVLLHLCFGLVGIRSTGGRHFFRHLYLFHPATLSQEFKGYSWEGEGS